MSIELKQAAQQAIDALNEAVAFREGGRQKAIDAANALRTTIQQVAQPAEVTDSMIREAFLTNGFTIKDGHSDLKPYVYAAARAILALRPVQVPMTDGEILHQLNKISDRMSSVVRLPKGWLQFARAIEEWHGITAKAKKVGM